MQTRHSLYPILWLPLISVIMCLGCSRDSETPTKEESTQTEDSNNHKGLDTIGAAEHLQRALEWANGKTPEQMLGELLTNKTTADTPFISWCYYVTQMSFIDVYGTDDAQTHMQEAYQKHYANNRKPSATRQTHSSGSLSKYPDIYELASQNPNLALERVEALLAHPDEKGNMRADIIRIYGMKHPLEALKMLETSNIPKYEAQKAISYEWAKSDPRAALAYVDELSKESSKLGWRHNLLMNIVEDNPLFALEAAVSMPINKETNYTVEKVAERYIEMNPEGGFEWLMAQEYLGPELITAGIRGLVQDHPEKANALMQAIGSERLDSRLLGSIGSSFAKRDPAQAMAWAKDLPISQHSSAYYSIFRTMSKEHPDQFLAYYASTPSTGITPKMFANIAKSFASKHPEKALQWAQSSADSPATAYAFGLAAKQLLRRDPNRISEMLSIADAGGYRSSMVGEIVDGWASADLDRATTWILQNSERSDLGMIVPKVAKEWFQAKPQDVLDFASQLPPGKARTSLIDAYVDKHAPRNLEDVVSYITTLKADEGTRTELNDAFQYAAKLQPNKAKALVDSITDPKSKDQAIQGTIKSLVKINLPDAAAWYAEVEAGDSEGIRRHTMHLIDQWANYDIEAGTQWALNLENQEKRHYASIRLLSKESVKNDHDLAGKLLRNAQPGTNRIDMTVSVIRTMPTTSTRDLFINSLPLTKNELLKVQERRKKHKL